MSIRVTDEGGSLRSANRGSFLICERAVGLALEARDHGHGLLVMKEGATKGPRLHFEMLPGVFPWPNTKVESFRFTPMTPDSSNQLIANSEVTMISTCTNRGSIEDTSNLDHLETSKSTASATSAPIPSHSPLLNLPAELREKIYAYVFGPSPRAFTTGKQTSVKASVRGFTTPSRYYPGYAIIGLPKWLLANKQIHAEAMDVFRRWRTFVFNDPVPVIKDADFFYGKPARSAFNSLTYGGSGNIASVMFQPSRTVQSKLRTPFRLDYTPGEAARFLEKAKKDDTIFLDCIYHGLGENACLDLYWDRMWCRSSFIHYYGGEWLEGEEEMMDCFDERWTGRFRKVCVRVRYGEAEWVFAQKMMKTARKCSRRLVGIASGEDVGVRWTKKKVAPAFRPMHLSEWESTLVIERKI